MIFTILLIYTSKDYARIDPDCYYEDGYDEEKSYHLLEIPPGKKYCFDYSAIFASNTSIQGEFNDGQINPTMEDPFLWVRKIPDRNDIFSMIYASNRNEPFLLQMIKVENSDFSDKKLHYSVFSTILHFSQRFVPTYSPYSRNLIILVFDGKKLALLHVIHHRILT